MTSAEFPTASPILSEEQLDDLQAFLKDWLRHTGRSQSDLRRALRAASIRMPVLLESLQSIHRSQGLLGLVDRLCDIEALWQQEDHQAGSGESSSLDEPLDSFGQLDLLLQEIRSDGQT